MNDMTLAPRSTIGGNNPPETLADEFALEFADDLREAEDLLKSAESAPPRFEDDETQNKAAELIKKMRALELKLDKARDAKKKPFAEKITAINGFFTTHMERLEKLRLTIKAKSTDYLDRKAAAERQRLREEEEKRRLAAEEAMRLAKDAEESRNAAARQADEASRLAADAEDAKRAAISEQEVAAAELAEAKAAHAAIKAAMLSIAADYARDAKDGKPATADDKKASRDHFEAKLAAAREVVEHAEEKLREARQRAAEAREQLRQQEEAKRKAEAAARSASRESEKSLTDAVRETKAADKIAEKVGGSDADLARTRSVHGAVSTLQRRWVCRVIDRALLDKAALWPFVNEEAIEAALWKWMQAQAPESRKMAGAVMEIETTGEVR